jgi:hypothetical protein
MAASDLVGGGSRWRVAAAVSARAGAAGRVAPVGLCVLAVRPVTVPDQARERILHARIRALRRHMFPVTPGGRLATARAVSQCGRWRALVQMDEGRRWWTNPI